MRQFNWDEIQEMDEFDNPTPGAYVAKICNVEDFEDKEYLRIEWDFAEGTYKDNNQETYDRAGFWPIVLIRSYKPKALGFFKVFKTALERSNPGYQFRENELRQMVGKRIGVVLGEEEYNKNDGSIGTRLYVDKTISLDAYQKGDFQIPKKKLLAAKSDSVENPGWSGSASYMPQDSSEPLPF